MNRGRPDPLERWNAGGSRRGPRDWTSLVLVVTTLSLSTVAMVFTAERLRPDLAGPAEGDPGPVLAERAAPADVDVWVGRRPDGVTLVLAGVWSDAGPDGAHDAALSEALALTPQAPLACYSLLLFNLSKDTRIVALGDGALVLSDGAQDAPLVNLEARLAREAIAPPAALRTVLQGLGALAQQVALPAGDSARVLVCFGRRIDLAQARGVRFGDGVAFSPRRMHRRDLQRLVTEPDEAQVSTL